MEITLKPTIKQHYAYQVLESNKLEYIHLLFGGAAGGGKSWLGCEWLIENCIRYPDTKWFIGREELKELRSSTLLTFFKVCKHHGLKPDIHYKFNGQDNYITFYNGSRIDLLDLRYLPRDPLYERYGSLEYTGGWLEEAGEVRFEAYDILKSRIGRWNNDKYGLNSKLLITGNPKKNWLYYTFYKPWRDKILPDELAFVQAFVDDNPYGESNYKNNLLSITDKATKERLLYGNWEYDDDPAKLIEYDNILDIFTNDFVKPGEKYITADIGRFGRDKTVIGVWNGYRLEYLATIARNKVTEAAEKIKQIRNTEFIPLHNIVVDEDGVGGGVRDILGCKGFVNNSRPANKENYNNLKSQCYFNLAKHINNNQYFINTKKLSTTDKEFIIEELEQVKKDKIDSDGKQCVVPKDKVKELLGRSPDYSDMMMMREYFNLKKRRLNG